MSSSIKDLYGYNLVKKCCRCKNILLKSNFNKNKTKKDGLQSFCIICFEQYHNKRKERRSILDKERRNADLNFKLDKQELEHPMHSDLKLIKQKNY